MATELAGQALLRLANWLSPAFPVGGFAYSGGLEQVLADNRLADGAELADWVDGLLRQGSLWNDAVLFSLAWQNQADAAMLAELSDLALAMAGSAERHMEIGVLGNAFVAAARAWPDPVLERLPDGAPYAVAVGAVAGAHGVALEAALSVFLNAAVNQAASVAIRCGLIGQASAQAIVAGLESRILDIAKRATGAGLDDLGSFSLAADIAAMNHETLGTRLFRS